MLTLQDGGRRNNQWSLLGRLRPRHGDGWAQVQVDHFQVHLKQDQ